MFRANRMLPIFIVLSLLAGLVLTAGIANAVGSHEQTIQAATVASAIAQPMAASDIVYTTRTGECYHRGSCSCLKKSKIRTTRGEAEKSGYRACSKCRP